MKLFHFDGLAYIQNINNEDAAVLYQTIDFRDMIWDGLVFEAVFEAPLCVSMSRLMDQLFWCEWRPLG